MTVGMEKKGRYFLHWVFSKVACLTRKYNLVNVRDEILLHNKCMQHIYIFEVLSCLFVKIFNKRMQ